MSKGIRAISKLPVSNPFPTMVYTQPIRLKRVPPWKRFLLTQDKFQSKTRSK